MLGRERGLVPRWCSEPLRAKRVGAFYYWRRGWQSHRTPKLLIGNSYFSTAGVGTPKVTPSLKEDREATAEEMGSASVQVPATSVQLSRGKAESHLLF